MFAQTRSTLTPTETVGLALRVRLSREARNELVEAHMDIAAQLALHYSRVSSAEYDELRSEGYLALIEAADSYDPLSGWAFESYAYQRVRKATYLYLGWTGGKKLPAQIRTELHQLALHRQRLEQKLGREPKTQELAEALGCSPNWVMELGILATEARSLEAKIGDDEEGVELGSLIADPSREFDPERQREVEQAHQKVAYLLNNAALTNRERRIVEEHYGLDAAGVARTQEEVAARLGISRQRVGQIEEAARGKMAITPLPPASPDEDGRIHHIYGDDEPPSPSATHHRCYQCGNWVLRWGSSSFKDWTYLARPWMTNHPGTVPRLWVCYRCSLTEQHRQRLAESLEARRDQLDHTTAVRMELRDPKTGKMTVAWVYAKSDRQRQSVNARKQTKQFPPMCSICHHECKDKIADIVVTSTYHTKWGTMYAMKYVCTTCYGRVGQKWEARKREAGLVNTGSRATQETASSVDTAPCSTRKAQLAAWLIALKQGDTATAHWMFQRAAAYQPPAARAKRQSLQEHLAGMITKAEQQVETCTAAWRNLKAASTRRFTLANNAGVMIVEDKRWAEKAQAAARRLFLAKSQLGALNQATRPLAPAPAPDEPGYGGRNMTLQGPFFCPEPAPSDADRKNAAARLMLLLPASARRRLTMAN
jgi:RNA polymerase primary sigma factor